MKPSHTENISIHSPGWFINNRILFLTGRRKMEAGSSRWGCQLPAWMSYGDSPLLGCRLIPSCEKRAKEFSRVSFIRTLILFMRAPPSWPNYFPRAHLLNHQTRKLGFQHVNFGGTHSVHNVHLPQKIPHALLSSLPPATLCAFSLLPSDHLCILSLQTTLNFQ